MCRFHGLHSVSGWPVRHCVCSPGPIVGEFPAQNDVNLAPAPSLPQVIVMFSHYTPTFINLTALPVSGTHSPYSSFCNMTFSNELHTARLCLHYSKLLWKKEREIFESFSVWNAMLKKILHIIFQYYTSVSKREIYCLHIKQWNLKGKSGDVLRSIY